MRESAWLASQPLINLPHTLPLIIIFPQETRGIIMRPMNEILADIIIALGGTVTDPNNRNQLLKDWLAAL